MSVARSDKPAKSPSIPGRDNGSTIVTILILLVLTGALTTAIASLSVTDHAAFAELRDDTAAFYLADTCLQLARYELSESVDMDNDGTYGNVAWTDGSDSYTVTMVDLGANTYQLTGSGTSGSLTTTLEEVVQVTSGGGPEGAILMCGFTDVNQVLTGSTTALYIDGVGGPGIVLTDNTMYNDMGTQFAQSVSDGHISASDITGSEFNTFSGTSLSISEVAEADSGISVPANLHGSLRSGIQTTFINPATSQSMPGSSTITWGTPASPVLYKFNKDEKLTPGQSLSGYGTLVFEENFIIENGASLDWEGNVIIYGENGNDAFFEIDGEMDVTGHVAVLSDNSKNLKFIVKSQGDVDITGALTLLADYKVKDSKAEFYVENDFEVDGVVTAWAFIHQTEFKPGCDADINGMFLYGRPKEGNTNNTTMQFTVEGDLDIIHDPTLIQTGAQHHTAIGLDLGIASSSSSSGGSVTLLSWRQY